MNILNVREEWSSLLLNFLVCNSCKFLYREADQIKSDECPHCRRVSSTLELYFPLNVFALIDLIQESYQSDGNANSEFTKHEYKHHLSISIYFCSLIEVLLQDFLEQRMAKMELPNQVQGLLLKDYRYVHKRVEKLFPTLIGCKWKETLKTLTAGGELDFVAAIEFYEEVVDKRNLLVHEGNKWAIPEDMPEKCALQLDPIIKLFVRLHNEFVAVYLNVAETT